MDFREIDFDPELAKDYKLCLNNCYVRRDRIACYCKLHKGYVSKKQYKRKKCFEKNCSHARRVKNELAES